MLDAFAASGNSPTFALVVLLVIDVVAWFLFIKALQKYTGRRSPHLPPDPEPWYIDDTVAGRATIFVPIGPTNDQGDTPILLMTVEPNGNTKAERATWQDRRGRR